MDTFIQALKKVDKNLLYNELMPSRLQITKPDKSATQRKFLSLDRFGVPVNSHHT